MVRQHQKQSDVTLGSSVRQSCHEVPIPPLKKTLTLVLAYKENNNGFKANLNDRNVTVKRHKRTFHERVTHASNVVRPQTTFKKTPT